MHQWSLNLSLVSYQWKDFSSLLKPLKRLSINRIHNSEDTDKDVSKNEQKRIQKKMNRKLAQGLAVIQLNNLYLILKDFTIIITNNYSF